MNNPTDNQPVNNVTNQAPSENQSASSLDTPQNETNDVLADNTPKTSDFNPLMDETQKDTKSVKVPVVVEQDSPQISREFDRKTLAFRPESNPAESSQSEPTPNQTPKAAEKSSEVVLETPSSAAQSSADSVSPDKNKIEAQDFSVNEEDDDRPDHFTQPIIAHKNIISALSTFAIIALAIGLVGGFYGYKYWSVNNLATISADILKPIKKPADQKVDTPKNITAENEIKNLTYVNTKYGFSLAYPGDLNDNGANITDNAQLSFTKSDLPSAKIEVAAASLQGKTLENFVIAQNTAAGKKDIPLVKGKIDGKDTISVDFTGENLKHIVYIASSDNVLIFTLSTSNENYQEAKIIFDKILNSVKF